LGLGLAVLAAVHFILIVAVSAVYNAYALSPTAYKYMFPLLTVNDALPLVLWFLLFSEEIIAMFRVKKRMPPWSLRPEEGIHIERQNAVTVRRYQKRRGGQKRAEGNDPLLSDPARQKHPDDRHDHADYGRSQKNHEHLLPAHERPQHGGHLDIAAPHGFLLEQPFSQVGDGQERPAADHQAHQRPDNTGGVASSEAASPTAMTGRVILSGMIWNSRSMKIITISAETRKEWVAQAADSPSRCRKYRYRRH